MADELFGIDNIKKLLKAGLNLGKHLAEDLKDGKLSFFEAIGLVPDVFAAISVAKSWGDIKKEIADLSAEEIKELEEYVVSEFNIPNEKVKVFIDHAVNHIISLLALIDEFKHINDEN